MIDPAILINCGVNLSSPIFYSQENLEKSSSAAGAKLIEKYQPKDVANCMVEIWQTASQDIVSAVVMTNPAWTSQIKAKILSPLALWMGGVALFLAIGIPLLLIGSLPLLIIGGIFAATGGLTSLVGLGTTVGETIDFCQTSNEPHHRKVRLLIPGDLREEPAKTQEIVNAFKKNYALCPAQFQDLDRASSKTKHYAFQIKSACCKSNAAFPVVIHNPSGIMKLSELDLSNYEISCWNAERLHTASDDYDHDRTESTHYNIAQKRDSSSLDQTEAYYIFAGNVPTPKVMQNLNG